jgi:CubicO group peptidase (beta-lactamase class C family)
LSENEKVIYTKAIGYSQLMPEKTLSTEKTKYRIGSISKMFTATLIFQLIDEGKLELSTTLSRFFPAVPNAEIITIGNLLGHRSGIHSFTDDSAYQHWMLETKTHEEMISIISAGKSEFEPGSRTAYSNSNFVLLGYIVETITGKAYDQMLQSGICEKAGLVDTYFGGKIEIGKNESYSYRYITTWEKQSETDMSIPHGAGSIVSTPSDLVRFIQALFAGKLISTTSLNNMTTITDGLGLGIQRFPFFEKLAYGHGGAIDGFNCLLGYFPEDKLAIAYCSNGTAYSINDIAIGALSIYYHKAYSLPVFTSFKVKPEDLDQYLGIYSSSQIPLKITISRNEGQLMGQATGQSSFPLEPASPDIFKFETAGIVIKFDPGTQSFLLEQGGSSFSFRKDQ